MRACGKIFPAALLAALAACGALTVACKAGDPGTGLVCLYCFEPGETGDWDIVRQNGAAVTDETDQVISGKGSLKADTTGKNGGEFEFFRTDRKKLPLKPGTVYTAYFKYRIVRKNRDCKVPLYFVASSGAGGWNSRRGEVSITSGEGTSSAALVTFIALDNYTDYIFTVGTRGKAVSVIDDFAVFERKAVDKNSAEKAIGAEIKKRGGNE